MAQQSTNPVVVTPKRVLNFFELELGAVQIRRTGGDILPALNIGGRDIFRGQIAGYQLPGEGIKMLEVPSTEGMPFVDGGLAAMDMQFSSIFYSNDLRSCEGFYIKANLFENVTDGALLGGSYGESHRLEGFVYRVESPQVERGQTAAPMLIVHMRVEIWASPYNVNIDNVVAQRGRYINIREYHRFMNGVDQLANVRQNLNYGYNGPIRSANRGTGGSSANPPASSEYPGNVIDGIPGAF